MQIYLYFKRFFDIILSVILSIVAIPVVVVSAIAIKFESEGSAFFIQERIGKNNKKIEVYKLRTMIIDRERNGQKLTDDQRITKVGTFLRKTSIDELPQILNILKGEMSFIGPRPLPVRYLNYYTEEELKRHEVLPGITGLAQVNGRNNLSWEEKFKYDLYYVENISFALDVKIFFITFLKVFKRSDVKISEPEEAFDVCRAKKELNNSKELCR